MIYGYCRVSTSSQNISRQIKNIKEKYPDAEILCEYASGKNIDDRKIFHSLLNSVKCGDTIVFDSISRMSRNSKEGFETYISMIENGVNIEFLKEPYANSALYRDSIGGIKDLFNQAEKEAEDRSLATKEGLALAKSQGKQIGGKRGSTLNVKKKEPCKQLIFEKSKDFNGSMKDIDLINELGIARNTYYKYKKELKEQ